MMTAIYREHTVLGVCLSCVFWIKLPCCKMGHIVHRSPSVREFAVCLDVLWDVSGMSAVTMLLWRWNSIRTHNTTPQPSAGCYQYQGCDSNAKMMCMHNLPEIYILSRYSSLFEVTYNIFIFYLFLTMMTSSNGNFFRVTGHMCGEFTEPRWIPRKKASDAELWCFLWSAPE